ncbi:hypothetical protein AVEN_177910-1 [Araneus ventricosus]|uniref:Uncharacterized protein n=1 Tax=Araneus ventricosus TaxID=182803 RepID=A0A4Y2JXP3_ARAVE|nr:hypothetical protein AVEN_177910-1 [Araneus ventricosus]
MINKPRATSDEGNQLKGSNSVQEDGYHHLYYHRGLYITDAGWLMLLAFSLTVWVLGVYSGTPGWVGFCTLTTEPNPTHNPIRGTRIDPLVSGRKWHSYIYLDE